MFPVVNPVMINTPELVQAGSLARLPWPDGSVVSARLMPTDTPGTALLLLGSYRLLAQVPPSIPMGEVWLMLVNRHMPARFELLTDMQALHLLAGMLEAEQNHAGKSAPRPTAADDAGKQAARAGCDIPDWPNLGTPQRGDGKQLPWTGEAAADGNTLLWYDRQDEQPRGMLHRQVGNGYFSLSGRVDLDQLGGVSFNLSGSIPQMHAPHPEQAADSGHAGQAMHLKLHGPEHHQAELRQGLAGWLAAQRAEFPGISGELCSEAPESGPGSLTECTG